MANRIAANRNARTSVRLALACCVATSCSALQSSFRPGEEWLDTAGAPIRAHVGGLLAGLAGEFYWYGIDNFTSGKTTPGHAVPEENVWINAYTSTDLLNWRNLGHAYTHPSGRRNCTNATVAAGTACGEASRPKVVRHPSGQLIMVTKSAPAVTFATASSEAGPFTFRNSIFPNGHWAGDLTVFVDPQQPADAYLIYSNKPSGPPPLAPHHYLVIAKLTPDWLDVEPEPVYTFPDGHGREAPAAFFVPAVGYFIWSSHCTGWTPNAAAVYHAGSMSSQSWTSLGNPTGNATSFASQSTAILPVNGSYIYVADRLTPYVQEKLQPRYVWLPITNISNSSLTVKWHDEWALPQ